MARKGPLNKLVNAAFDAVKDPVGATGKTLGLAKEAVAIGRMLAGQVTQLAVDKAAETVGGSSAGSAPGQEPDDTGASLRSVPPVERPGDAARGERPGPVPAPSSDPATTGVPAKKTAQQSAQQLAKKAPVKKAPARRPAAPMPPAGRAPAKKTPAKKSPAKKSPAKAQGDPTMVTPADIAENVTPQPAKKAARKAPAKKAAASAAAKTTASGPARKSAAKKATPATVAKKASAGRSAKKTTAKKTTKTAEQVANADGPAVSTPVGTTAASEAINPDTTDHDLQQPGTEPIVDPGTAKAIRSESQTLQRAADTDKG